MLERGPVEILHRNEGLAFMLSDFVDGADVGVIQGGRGSRLASKAFQCLLVVSYFLGQEFQGYETAEFRVLSSEDDSHATTAKFLQDAVVRDSLADHWLEDKNSGQLPRVSMLEGRRKTVKAFEQKPISSYPCEPGSHSG